MLFSILILRISRNNRRYVGRSRSLKSPSQLQQERMTFVSAALGGVDLILADPDESGIFLIYGKSKEDSNTEQVLKS